MRSHSRLAYPISHLLSRRPPPLAEPALFRLLLPPCRSRLAGNSVPLGRLRRVAVAGAAAVAQLFRGSKRLDTLISRATSHTGVVAVKQPNFLRKVAAVVSALLLAGGYVSYRAGAFKPVAGLITRPADAGNGSTSEVMSGTKSSFIFTGQSPDTTTTPPPAAEPPAPTIMYGTKSAPVDVLPKPATPSADPASSSEPAKPAP
jgi:hypothetical protein